MARKGGKGDLERLIVEGESWGLEQEREEISAQQTGGCPRVYGLFVAMWPSVLSTRKNRGDIRKPTTKVGEKLKKRYRGGKKGKKKQPSGGGVSARKRSYMMLLSREKGS